MNKKCFVLLTAPLLATAALRADESPAPLKQGDVAKSNQLSPGYNQAGQYSVKGGANLFVTADFLYWIAVEDALDQTRTLTVTNNFVDDLELRFQDFEYRPGFKVGVGIDTPHFDGWTVYGQYTWYHHTFHSHFALPAEHARMKFFLIQFGSSGENTNGNTFNFESDWKLGLDLFDLSLQRAFYLGKRVIFTPSFGLRYALLDQRLETETTYITSAGVLQFFRRGNRYKSNSWGIGPRVGFEGNWLLGWGFRLIGNGYASILQTTYSHVHAILADARNALPIKFHYRKKYKTLRAITELSLGAGWGDYLCNQRYHLDFALTYDFNIFWNQNLMRELNNQLVPFTAEAPGNLNLHGLTAQARFDF